MVSDYAELKAGQVISKRSYLLDDALVSGYLAAVGDESRQPTGERGERLAPAMAIAALGIRGAVQDLRIPGGTLHAGQELAFAKAAAVGQTLECVATLTQNSLRGEWRFLAIECRVANAQREEVMSGKSMIMIPAGLAPRGEASPC